MVMQGMLLDTTALAAVALIGFLWGRRSRAPHPSAPTSGSDDLAQAQRVVIEIQRTADQIRRELASHQGGVSVFCQRLEEYRTAQETVAPGELAAHAQAQLLLNRTQTLAATLSSAYDDLRQQTSALMSLSGSRLDEATGAYNRQAMLEHLESMLALDPGQADQQFSVATLSLTSQDDGDDEQLPAPQLARVARILETCARDTDFVARYGADEFAVLMPQTALPGAIVFCDRVLRRVTTELGLPTWGGVAQAMSDEPAAKLLSRTDAALYTARTQPSACLYMHDGSAIRRHVAGSRGTVVADADETVADRIPVEA
ncbi:MAG: GGDEF domain-containing protein [Planctomycetales bacterium]|nr:GGDEF domain-containing protein [Planctomycetales bacterium]